jgi:ribulose-5-phosphate 4-epimerase/fuculose-1-phosphate aldolase
MTPTGASLGELDPARLSLLSPEGRLLLGDPPTKERPLHDAIYAVRAEAGAVVHLHSTHSVALSLLPDTDPDCVLPPITPYSIMRLGRVKLLPYFRPGDPAMGKAVRAIAGRHPAILLANHGPVVAGRDLDAAVFGMEEFEETARLVILTFGRRPVALSEVQIAELVDHFELDEYRAPG